MVTSPTNHEYLASLGVMEAFDYHDPDVVNKIAGTPTGGAGPFPRDVPKTIVLIKSASVVSQ